MVKVGSSKNFKKLGWVKSIQEPFILKGTSVFPHLCLPPPASPTPMTQDVRNLDGTGTGWGQKRQLRAVEKQ